MDLRLLFFRHIIYFGNYALYVFEILEQLSSFWCSCKYDGGISGSHDLQEFILAVGNEGLSAGIIVTKAPVEPVDGAMFVSAPFARIDQSMSQTLSDIGPSDPTVGEGAKGITWNKAIQAAWIANQGVKELENVNGVPTYVKEGSYISQSTTQLTDNVYDYAAREGAKVLNVDNKLAMIVDDLNAIINLQASANSQASDSQSSAGTITNNVNVTVSGTDP